MRNHPADEAAAVSEALLDGGYSSINRPDRWTTHLPPDAGTVAEGMSSASSRSWRTTTRRQRCAEVAQPVEGADIRRGTILHAIKDRRRNRRRGAVVDISEGPFLPTGQSLRRRAPDAGAGRGWRLNEVAFYRHLVRNMGVAEYFPKPMARDRVARLFAPKITGGHDIETTRPRGGTADRGAAERAAVPAPPRLPSTWHCNLRSHARPRRIARPAPDTAVPRR